MEIADEFGQRAAAAYSFDRRTAAEVLAEATDEEEGER